MADLREQGFPLAALCRALDVSPSGYYAWKRGRRSSRAEEDRCLMPQVRAVFREHKRRYEIVPASDHRQPPPLGIQPESALKRLSTTRRGPCLGR
jgi:hypothetical protein